MRQRLEDAVGSMDAKGADYADIRYESYDTTSIQVKNSSVEEVSQGSGSGVGCRAFVDGVWGFASTSDTEMIDEAAKRAVKAAKALRRRSPKPRYSLGEAAVYDTEVASQSSMPLSAVPIDAKIAIVEDAETEMRFAHDAVRSSKVRYADFEADSFFVSSEGSFIKRSPTHASLYCHSTARRGDRTETFLEREATLGGFKALNDADPMQMGVKSAEKAVEMLDASAAPQGRMPVALGDRIGGLFAHEAVGHAAEADGVVTGESIFAGRMGDKVGCDCVTIVDDPGKDGHGRYRFDDEGVKGERTAIIDSGRMNGFLHSRDTAARTGAASTGNCRAESFRYRPSVRMSNTFFAPGSSTDEEIIASIEEGVLLEGFEGGQVSTSDGNFTFGTTYGYRIKDGERNELVKGPTISGDTLAVLQEVSMVSGEESGWTPGFCGKHGQTVFVDTGSPLVLVDEMVVG